MLIFVVFLGLGFCGLDHCLVGNFILGTLKLLTVGARHPEQYTVSVRFHPEEPFQKVLRSKTEAASRTLAGSARLPASSTRPSSSRS